ncbi:Sulfate/thiosulfate import ATP-binding protein CysA [Magnetospirillum sp. LM-5]|uniref:sulfate/molybdate ABC transporter ATP-binding protein n=1 Tax=Magnetospirillum sp. LM-5 TaxID=2681466 RepID=UPI0013814427|nr:sulfate/molybdate ABC transporter ATP-binding protein [Magnetospirillum sp. LM-5]CAA7612654.1 Sulfate/thiosulfate import ATP-binding protein CysA [Magnetospirillum sp. LM-5]
MNGRTRTDWPGSTATEAIRIDSVSRRFGAFQALDQVSLSVAPGELVALLGPSGSGKTTLLRLLAGLDFPDAGAIALHGADATHLPTGKRGIGFVFQNYALFRHMSVADNIAFGLKVRPRGLRPPAAEIAARVERLLHLVKLDGLGGRYPAQLSGGQRQRVALARALAIEPRLLLLDEPFGALDAQVRKGLRRWVRDLHHQLGLTGVLVTHDQEEALEIADRVVVMKDGRIEQVGTPRQLYDHPASPFVWRFLGQCNALPCVVENGLARIGDLALAASPGDGPGTLFFRPHDVILGREGGVLARISHVTVTGAVVRVELDLAGHKIEAELTRETADRGIEVGQTVGVTLRKLAFFGQ